MQTANGRSTAQGFCREEFQAFLKYFVDPYMRKMVKQRYDAEKSARQRLDLEPAARAEFFRCKDEMDQGTGEWQHVLQGGSWEWVEHYDQVWTDEFPDMGNKPSKPLSWSFCQIVDDWHAKLHGAFHCLLPHSMRVKDSNGEGGKAAWCKGAWFTHERVPLSAYRPTDVPYFVSYDRGAMHSLWTDTKQKVHLAEPGVPVMQIIMMPPRGHDLHQIIEHAIGVGKGHAARVLGRARMRREKLTTKLAYDAYQEGIKKYTAESWRRNFFKVCTALKLVRAREVDTVRWMERRPNGHVAYRSAKGTGGNYVYMQYS